MAEEKKKSAPESGVSVFNKGHRIFRTSKGPLKPDHSLVIPKDEADVLLKYPEVMETGKVGKRDSRTIAQLREENEKLKAEKEKLTADLEEATAPKKS